MDYPEGFPDHLKPAAHLAVLKANRRFPKLNQSKKRIRQATFELCELACVAAENGEWQSHLALEGIEDFLHILCVDDPALHSYVGTGVFGAFSDPIKWEITATEQWFGYVERLAEAGKSRRLGNLVLDRSNRRTNNKESPPQYSG